MRGLLLLILAPSIACVTTVQRHRGPQRSIATRCAQRQVLAELAPTRNQVRLRFDRLEQCVSDYEEVWVEETDTRIATPMVVTLSVLAAAAVMTPLFAARMASRPNPPPPPAPDSGPLFVDWVKTVGTLAVGVIAASAVWWATDRRLGGGTVQKLELSTRPEDEKRVRLQEGRFAAEGISSRPLIDGRVDLSFAEASGMDVGGLTLDGAEVKLVPANLARLAALKLCRQALEDLDPQTPKALSEPRIERKLTQAFGCRRAGWDFAESVITRLSAFPLRIAP